MIPATNILTTDCPAITAYRIIGMDGGMMIASELEELTMAAEYSPE